MSISDKALTRSLYNALHRYYCTFDLEWDPDSEEFMIISTPVVAEPYLEEILAARLTTAFPDEPIGIVDPFPWENEEMEEDDVKDEFPSDEQYLQMMQRQDRLEAEADAAFKFHATGNPSSPDNYMSDYYD